MQVSGNLFWSCHPESYHFLPIKLHVIVSIFPVVYVETISRQNRLDMPVAQKIQTSTILFVALDQFLRCNKRVFIIYVIFQKKR